MLFFRLYQRRLDIDSINHSTEEDVMKLSIRQIVVSGLLGAITIRLAPVARP